MPFVTPRMSLKTWNDTSDPYDHTQLYENFIKVDLHDHTQGRGTQIPTAGIEDGAITAAKLAASVTANPSPGSVTLDSLSTEVKSDYSYALATWKTFAHRGMRVLGNALGTGNMSMMGWDNSNSEGFTFTQAGPLLYINPDDYTAPGRIVRFRIRSHAAVGGTAPGTTLTVALRPLTFANVAAGADPRSDPGTPVTGGSLAFTSLLANSQRVLTTAEFTVPAAGYYTLAVSSIAATAANSRTLVSAYLDYRMIDA